MLKFSQKSTPTSTDPEISQAFGLKNRQMLNTHLTNSPYYHKHR